MKLHNIAIPALLVVLIVLPRPGFAVTCHCFKEREFKPSQPASADPYILATTRNSLVAAASGIDKGAVVRLRMKGVDETELWLSYYLSNRVNRSADQLLDARDQAASWAAALDSVKLDTSKLGTAFNDARKAADAEGMARALADPVMGKVFEAGEPALGRLKVGGANIAESALSLYLAGRMKKSPEAIYTDVKDGKKTWGELLYGQGIKIDTIGDIIAETVKKRI